MTLLEAAKQVLEALEYANQEFISYEMANGEQKTYEAIIALRTAISEAEKQEPVAWMEANGNVKQKFWKDWDRKTGGIESFGFDTPLYTHPAPAVPEGWKLVPIEPTLKMLDCLRSDTTPNLAKRYKAMLNAAPEAP